VIKPDYTEVSRKAHELGKAHGRNAHTYAGKLAKDGLAEGKPEEHVFWKAVEAELTARNLTSASGPVAIWNGQPERSSPDHDSVHDEP
jgi:hypothetical protein